MPWECVLEYDDEKRVTAGNQESLTKAIRRAADLSIYTEFHHGEHIDSESNDNQLVREVAQRGVTYLLDDHWSAGIITQRQPIEPPDGFGPRPSLSFFMYNQDGQQAAARPYIDGPPTPVQPNDVQPPFHDEMKKLTVLRGADRGTNAPSHSFKFAFDRIRYWVRDDWEEVLSHSEDGTVITGSLDALAQAFEVGADMKVGIRGLCSDLDNADGPTIEHEVFINLHAYYYYTEIGKMMGATFPLVRIRPSIPLEYFTKGWDFGWVLCRTDGHVALMLYDPYTLRPRREYMNLAVRWFVR